MSIENDEGYLNIHHILPQYRWAGMKDAKHTDRWAVMFEPSGPYHYFPDLASIRRPGPEVDDGLRDAVMRLQEAVETLRGQVLCGAEAQLDFGHFGGKVACTRRCGHDGDHRYTNPSGRWAGWATDCGGRVIREYLGQSAWPS